ncbi:hypothetical protein F7Q99_15470 [Streptomyces kaniharaensis]|uniref:Aminodeoxyfutalosine deaminase/Imidazolonepropionase-like composite domain-containing protein n=1 Tax=Streptomyces kaniharaensis TaxID=212423 RepID=A0A6N7KPY2_9ACTN|nr:hypothetical protein [Streptomyces kaniharaensis]MQS13632.1 hypothetical protein [Streptomyces kaniharaensis]
MLTLHRAAFVLPDPADPTAPSLEDGAVLVRGELVEAVGSFDALTAEHPGARVREWGQAVLTPGLRNPYGHWLLERAYHPDPREEIGVEPVRDGLVGEVDDARCGASARRGLQRMLGFGVTAVAGPFERAAVRTAVARSGLVGSAGGPVAGAGEGEAAREAASEGPLDPLAVLPLAAAVHGRVVAGGRADFAVFTVSAAPAASAIGGEGGGRPMPGGCLATVLGGRLVYRRR